jgi:hypothetical protein
MIRETHLFGDSRIIFFWAFRLKLNVNAFTYSPLFLYYYCNSILIKYD